MERTVKRILLSSTAALVVSAGASAAATMSFTDTVSLRSTNWAESLSIQQFDPLLGTLNSVRIFLKGFVEGSIQAENLDNSQAVVDLDLSAQISAGTSTLGSLVSVLPISSVQQTFAPFDNTPDFAGVSSYASGTLNASDDDSALITSNFGDFIGAGLVSIDLDAQGRSASSAAGNFASIFRTNASAEVTVTYDYTAFPPPSPVPLPAGLPLLLVGLGALGLTKRRSAS